MEPVLLCRRQLFALSLGLPWAKAGLAQTGLQAQWLETDDNRFHLLLSSQRPLTAAEAAPEQWVLEPPLALSGVQALDEAGQRWRLSLLQQPPARGQLLVRHRSAPGRSSLAFADLMLDAPSLSRSARSSLPWPWLPSRPDWLAVYEAAWAALEAQLKRSSAEPDDKAALLDHSDTCFTALYAMYGVGSPAQGSMAQLDRLYRSQRPDGALVAGPDRVRLPLLAWVELRYWQRSGDASRLTRVVPLLDRHWRWLEVQDAELEAKAQLLQAAECMVVLAGQQRDAALASHYRSKAEQLAVHLNEALWHEAAQRYADRPEAGPAPRRVTLGNFWPLLTSAPSAERARATIERWLKAPAHFNTPHRFPSLPRSDADYSPLGQLGRGHVSVAANFALIQGLLRHDPDFAFDSALKQVEQMSAVFHRFDPAAHPLRMPTLADETAPRQGNGKRQLWQAYSPEQLAPATRPDGKLVRQQGAAAAGLGPVALLIEQLLGIDVRADAGFIAWTPRLPEPQGLDRIGFQGGRVSLRLEPRGEQWQLSVQNDRKLLLVLALPGRAPEELTLSPGRYQELL